MNLTSRVGILRRQLAVAADVGVDEARTLPVRLTAPPKSATLLNALSAAMGEDTRKPAPISVEVRLRGSLPRSW
ncbi:MULTISPECIES: hypothetical protein [unclassified Streptomyces]|uniref:hypothetical protein n=1 Tax=unclassified Streptomyces TaxID=2593676 RepID=UPI00095EF9EF|nr:hypothetical protein [Streptomyces sp. TSRI0281]OKI48451.1 hypothetical protein A6A29_05470 [Streptomyces sp. TSRI0281]